MGDISTGMLLYEGNWKKWKVLMHAVLTFHDFVIEDDRIKTSQNGPGLQEAVAILEDMIHINLLGRLGKREWKDPNDLLLVLKTLAQPFRFTDLPEDVRSMVYDVIAAEHDDQQLHLNCASPFEQSWAEEEEGLESLYFKKSFPTFTHCSSLLRKEYSPILWRSIKIDLDFVVGERGLLKELHRFIRSVVKNKTSHIRELRMTFFRSERGGDGHRLDIHCQPTLAYREISKPEGDVSNEDRNKVRHAIEESEITRRSLQLNSGQALLLVLTNNMWLWSSLGGTLGFV